MFSGDDNSHLRTRSEDASIVVPREMDDRRYARQVIGSGGAYGTANARDAELHLLQQTASNGVVVTSKLRRADQAANGHPRLRRQHRP
jgi:hypothetical protein